MAPPIQFGLGLSLARAGGAALDADAAAYIAAVETAGATVSGGQKSAIDTFYKTGKSDGWYSSIKRMYLPIWASAAPNAIDMIALGSGTFNGTVTHAAGYVEGDGTTGYFDTAFNPSTNSITNASAWMGGIFFDSSGNAQAGAFTAAGTTLIIASLAAPSLRSEICGSTRRYDTSVTLSADRDGIFSANRRSGTTRHRVIGSGGVEWSNDFTDTNAGTMPNGNFYFLARNRIDTSSVDQFWTAKHGAMWLGAGVAASGDEAFALALKNLWEGTTGLTLP
jgi:hypothetical protein